MAFYPDVTPGSEFKPNALLENNVRHLLNAMDGFSPGCSGGAFAGIVRVQVYNRSSEAIPAGSAAGFVRDGDFIGDLAPVSPISDPALAWGVVPKRLEAGEAGDLIVAGTAVVALAGGSGTFAAPLRNGGFVRASAGAPILFESNGRALIGLGMSAASSIQGGPYAVSYDAVHRRIKVGAGYINRNGEFGVVPEGEAEPRDGEICVTTELNGEGRWSSARFAVMPPSLTAYPIGHCTVEGKSVSVVGYGSPVAVFMLCENCVEE